jgi:hypothetical protein
MNETAKVDAVGQSSQTSSTQAKATPLKAPEPFVDSEEAGRFLSLRPRRVLELARRGAIPAHPLGEGLRKVWRFRLSELASAVCARGVDCVRQSPAPRQEIT